MTHGIICSATKNIKKQMPSLNATPWPTIWMRKSFMIQSNKLIRKITVQFIQMNSQLLWIITQPISMRKMIILNNQMNCYSALYKTKKIRMKINFRAMQLLIRMVENMRVHFKMSSVMARANTQRAIFIPMKVILLKI